MKVHMPKLLGIWLETMDANQLFGANARTEEILIPKGTKYSIESYSISQAHETYLRGIASETRWRGGLYDLQAGILEPISKEVHLASLL